MAFRGSVGVVLIAIALVASGEHTASSNVKVAGESSAKIPKSINHEGNKHAQNLILEDDHFADHSIQGSMQTRIDSIDDTFDHNETDFHSAAGKPSKFDRDITGLIHTDLKSMHESEAARLKAKLESEKSNLSANNGSVVESTINTNSTRRMDDEETMSEDGSVDDSGENCNGKVSMVCLEQGLGHLVERMSNIDVYNITDYAQIVRNSRSVESEVSARDDSVIDKVTRYAKEHALNIRMPSDQHMARGARFFFSAFGLKNLMLPIVIGMKIVNSVLIALFLPSILGGIGRILGKGVSSFSQVSQSATTQPEESFEFKDNADIYNDDYMRNQPIGTLPASAMYNTQEYLNTGNQNTGTTGTNQRISYVSTLSDNYYSRNSMQGAQGATKRQDYKVFHEIPTSSLLLTNYDPFYSPLLSRLDAVFSRLGHSTEPCREFAICAMYRSPGRYAPYSNLVSAQLSRELNELRKPTSDNPDVLRFFKYMKAAKDGQDGVECEDVYTECASRGNTSGQNQAMLATYQDINKLVQARKI